MESGARAANVIPAVVRRSVVVEMESSSGMDVDRTRADFDELAALSAEHGDSGERYDDFLVDLVPRTARSVLDVGCGVGRLAARVANEIPGLGVLGIDLSERMIERARSTHGASPGLEFRVGDIRTIDLGRDTFDVVLSAACLHHLEREEAMTRLIGLVRPGGTLIVHDLRGAESLWDRIESVLACGASCVDRFSRTGRWREPRVLREAWERHGAGERYLTFDETVAMARRHLRDPRVYRHFFWRTTIVATIEGIGSSP